MPYKSYPCRAGRGWGGARNRADRVTDCITETQARKVLAAVAFAMLIGLPFNRHWIVHIDRAGVAPADRVRFIGSMLAFMHRRARRAGIPFAAVWIREDGARKGAHVHVLLHIGPGLSLRGLTLRAIRQAGGNPRKGVSRAVAIGGRLSAANDMPEHYQANAVSLLLYLLKGCSAEAAERLGLPRWGEGGTVTGKRLGWTENIGEAARKRWAWRGLPGQGQATRP